MKTEKELKERRCVVCKNVFNIQKNQSSGRWKQAGRQKVSKGNYTCSKKCALVYNNMIHHFSYRYNIWKQKRNTEVKQVINLLPCVREERDGKVGDWITKEELLQKLGLNNKEVYGDE